MNAQTELAIPATAADRARQVLLHLQAEVEKRSKAVESAEEKLAEARHLLDDARDRQRVDRSIMAAFSRALVQRSLSREAERVAYARGHEEGTRNMTYRVEQARNETEQLRERIVGFQTASGVNIDTWDAGELGQAFAAFQRLRGAGFNHGLPVDQARRVAEKVESLADDLAALRAFLSGGSDSATVAP